MNEIIPRGTSLPELTPGEMAYRNALEILELSEREFEVHQLSLDEQQEVLAEIDAVLPALPQISHELAKLSAPASKLVIGTQVAAIHANFINAKFTNAHTAVLLDNVGATRPSVGAMEEAARYIIRTSEWPPVTATLLGAIDDAESKIRRAQRAISEMPARREKLAARVTDGRADAERRAEREARRKAMEP